MVSKKLNDLEKKINLQSDKLEVLQKSTRGELNQFEKKFKDQSDEVKTLEKAFDTNTSYMKDIRE